MRMMQIRLSAVMLAVFGVVSAGSVQAEDHGDITKYARFKAGDLVAYGVVEGDRIRQIHGDLFGEWELSDKTYGLDQVKLLAPTEPRNVLATAGNYRSHLGEQAEAHPQPELFLKTVSSLAAQGEDIVYPSDANNVHHESELVIVIGKKAKDVSEEEALDYVLGVTCGNDVSERDWQQNDVQWWRAKASDTFSPVGPYILSGADYGDLMLEMRVNGEVRQKQSTKDLIHGVASLVSFASKYVTLYPGDLMFTGTPGTTKPIKPGDVCEVELEHLGVLRNEVVAE